MNWHFEHPTWLWLMCAVPPALWVARYSLTDLSGARRGITIVLRAGTLCALICALAGPRRLNQDARVALVYAVDVSDSVSDTALARVRAHLADVRRAAHPGTSVELITFARDARRVPASEAPGGDALRRHPPRDPGEVTDAGSESAPDTALQLAMALLPPDRVARVLLATDGLETRGDLLGASDHARAAGVAVDTLAIREELPAEVAITGIKLPPRPAAGESFHVTIGIHATRPAEATLRLYQDDLLNGLEGVRKVTLKAGKNELRFRSIARLAGPVRYRAEIEPAGHDRFAQNNRAETAAWIAGRPRILLVGRQPAHLSPLAQALATADYDVDVRPTSAAPRTTAEVKRYDFVIVTDLDPADLDPRTSRALVSYVRDHGGGLLATGGANAFGLGDSQPTPLARLLPVVADPERRRDEHSLALSLVIDTSGSMAGSKISLAKEAAKAAADLLADGDRIQVVGFSSTPKRIVRLQEARSRARIARDIRRLMAQGGTAIFPALDTAYQDLSLTDARLKHVILLTDGQTQETGVPELARAMRAEGITVSTVGLGRDVNRSLLQRVANLGDGRAYFTDDPSHVPRIFMRETTSVTQTEAIEELVRARVQTPADFLKGIPLASAPVLSGYVMTRARRGPVQVVLASELGDPLLARSRAGLGWVLAWTSDLEPRWASAWLRWPRFTRFIGQLAREHMRRTDHDELPLDLQVDQGELVATVDALGPDDRFLNGLTSTLEVTGPEGAPGTPETRRVQLSQVAPGRYTGRVPLGGFGAFSAAVRHERDGRTLARSRGQLLHPYPAEYAHPEPDLGLLRRVARHTGGVVDPTPAQTVSARGRSVSHSHHLWPYLAGVALALFLLELAVRQLWPAGKPG